MKILFRITVLLALVACLSVWAALRSFRLFLEEELVAVVQCESAPPDAGYKFLLEVAQMEHGAPAGREKLPMNGDQWSIGGDFLKWKPWAVFLGAKPLHKLTRLSSRYDQAKDELEKPRSVYDLNGGTNLFWRCLRRWGIALPGVDAVYGSAAYVPMLPGGRWGVYVTHAGYLIRPF